MADIFISHTEEDKEQAIQIASALEREGYTTWYYERDAIPGPSYLIQVGREIEVAQTLLLVASQSSMKSQHVTNEVIRAYEHGKHFLPVLFGIVHQNIQEQQPIWRQCIGSTTSIPLSGVPFTLTMNKVLAGLSRLGVEKQRDAQRIPASHPAKRESDRFFQQEFRPTYDQGMSTVQFGDGIVSFRTERFEPVQWRTSGDILRLGFAGEREPLFHGISDGPLAIELAFQLLNQTSHRFTITGIRGIYFGKVVVVEDCPVSPIVRELHTVTLDKLSMTDARLPLTSRSTRRIDLGMLEFAFAGDSKIACAETSSLLKPIEVEFLPAHSLRSFLLTLSCMETEDRPPVVMRHELIEFVQSVSHKVLAMELLQPTEIMLVEKTTLADLDNGQPEPVGVAHVFAISAALVADTNAIVRLYSDNIYSLLPRLRRATDSVISLEHQRGVIPLEKWFCQTPSQFVQYMVNWSVKVFQETLAFHIALEHDQLPQCLYPNEVSPFCYRGDLTSPLRIKQANDTIPREQRLSSVERSNLITFLANLFTRWPEFGCQIWEALGVLEMTDSEILKNKVTFVRRKLTALAASIQAKIASPLKNERKDR